MSDSPDLSKFTTGTERGLLDGSVPIVGRTSAMITIGIDNGTSGSWSVLGNGWVYFAPVPTKMSLLGKMERRITRIDVPPLLQTLRKSKGDRAYVERPFTGRFLNAVLPAQRAFEAVLIALETAGVPYEVIDSKVWQKPMLGAVKGSENLKRASMELGIKLYPQLAYQITKHGDADGLLIAHYFSYR